MTQGADDVNTITVTLAVDPDDVDESASCGLTEEADSRLADALLTAGFEIVSGPDRA